MPYTSTEILGGTMPKRTFQLDVPKEAKEQNLEQEYLSAAQAVLKEQAVLRLYKEQKVSTGTAAHILRMPLADFMLFAGAHQVSVFPEYTAKELAAELRAANRASRALK